MTRTRAKEYRRQAQECLALASTASTEEALFALIERAEVWFRLAEEQDHESANVYSVPLSPMEDRPVVQQQQQVQPKDDGKSVDAGVSPMADNDDPHAPYKLYDGDKLIGTYKTRAESRRKQQQLESQAGSEQHFFTIKDREKRIVL